MHISINFEFKYKAVNYNVITIWYLQIIGLKKHKHYQALQQHENLQQPHLNQITKQFIDL